MNSYLNQKIDTATHDICSVAVSGVSESAVRKILQELVDSVALKTVEEAEKLIPADFGEYEEAGKSVHLEINNRLSTLKSSLNER